MRRAAKVDSNHLSIVKALRQMGCEVLSLAAVGKGVPDLLVCRGHRLCLIEVKDGEKVKSAQKLTPDQVAFHSRWPVHVVTNLEEAVNVVNNCL